MSDETVDFAVLCAMFDVIERTRKPAMKKKHIRTFLDREYTDRNFYSAIRLMLPKLDRDRTYGVKESALGGYICEALGLAKESPDAQKLLNWRKGGTRVGINAGNFAAVAHEILFTRQLLISKGLKIKQVNDILDRLAGAQGKEAKVAILREAITKSSSKEMFWIILIILKDLKLGIGDNPIFGELHPDAEEQFSLTCDLRVVCERCRDRNVRLSKLNIEVGKAVMAQRCERATNVDWAWKKLKGKEVTVECKFDGNRIQIHKDGTKLHFYSRTFIDHQEYHTAMADVLLAQNVLPEKCVLDGELLAKEKAEERFLPFGTIQEVAKEYNDGVATSRVLCYVAFDILYLGSNTVISRPLRERRELLREAVQPVKGRLELVSPQNITGQQKWSLIAKSAEEVKHFFDQRVNKYKEEGIVLKDLDSKWEPNHKSSTKWLKLKPDYENPLADLDILVIGGYYGSGRRGGQVAQFLLGIAEKPTVGDTPSTFLSFCKVGTGLSDEESERLVQKLNPYFIRNDKKTTPPSCYRLTSKERPDVWVDKPEKSVLLVVASDNRTIDTEVFAAPYGLRFPRVLRIKDEKPWNECLTVDDLHAIVKNTREGVEDAKNSKEQGTIGKKSKGGNKRPRAPPVALVPSHLSNTDVSNVKPSTKILTGLEFYIINNPVEHTRQRLHELVAEHGGRFSMNHTRTVTHAIASERKGIKFEASAAHGDVIHYSWIIDCCDAKTLLPLSPKYYLHLSTQTKEKRKDEIDDFGDQYFADIDATDLSQLFKNVDIGGMVTDHDGLARVMKKHCSSLTFCQFSDCNFYFHKPIHSSNLDSQVVAEIALKRQELEVSIRAGAVSETLDVNVTHMIVYTSSDRVLPFRTIVKSVDKQDRGLLLSDKLKILRHQWIDDYVQGTIGQGREINYELKDPSYQRGQSEAQWQR